MGKRINAFKQLFSQVKWLQGRKSLEVHVFTLRPEAEFPSGIYVAEDARNGVFSLRGLQSGILALAGMAFDATKFTKEKATAELRGMLSALPPLEISTMKFAAGNPPKLRKVRNYEYRTYEDETTGEKFADLFNVLAIKGGIWQSAGGDVTFLEENLERMVENSKLLKGKLETYFSKEHESAGPKAGILGNYRRKGKDILVDIFRVPIERFNEIEAGKWAGLSAEVKSTWEDSSDGKLYKDVLVGLTVLGIKERATSSLPPLISFEIDDSDNQVLNTLAQLCVSETVELASVEPTKKEPLEMEEKEILERLEEENKVKLEVLKQKMYNEARDELVEGKVELLLEAEKITPGEVDEVTKALKCAPKGPAFDMLYKQFNEREPIKIKTELTKGGDTPPEEDERDPDVIINERAEKLSRDEDISFKDAICKVMAADTKLEKAEFKQFVGSAPKEVTNG